MPKLSDKYHKIMSIFFRDERGKMVEGIWSTDEIKHKDLFKK